MLLQIGEGFVGFGPNAAHTNTVLGDRSGPTGVAWATALATPRAGHVPFMVIAQTGIAVTPPTLFVNKAAIENDKHGLLTWGAAQAGVAAGVGAALKMGVIDPSHTDDLVLIAAVWVNPAAHDEEEVFVNQRQAILDALSNGRAGKPTAADVMKAAENVSNPFFQTGK
ncbi:MAG: formaldehyde-activating enzyme [Actinobacteria bacterium]|nr:formaldehyde-activating enzyme [Actinomycetota bacterium]